MIAVGIARYLKTIDAVAFNYDELSTNANVFIEGMPAEPIDAIAIMGSPGPGSDVKLGYDNTGFQIIVRASGNDPRVAEAKAWRIYDRLHGLHRVTLPDGTYVVGCSARQSGPVSMASDANGNYEFSCNFDAEVRSLTSNRE